MPELRDLLVGEVERIRMNPPPSFEVLAGRARRRHALRMLTRGAAVIVVIGTVIGTVVLQAGNDRASLTPTRPAAPARPLIARGECGGLSVTAMLPGHPQRWSIRPGTQPKPIEMPPNALMWLLARGPCVDRLRISATSELIQTATGGVTAFNKQGIGVIVSNDKAGQANIELFYSLHIDQVGPASRIATIPVNITRNATVGTLSPSPSP